MCAFGWSLNTSRLRYPTFQWNTLRHLPTPSIRYSTVRPCRIRRYTLRSPTGPSQVLLECHLYLVVDSGTKPNEHWTKYRTQIKWQVFEFEISCVKVVFSFFNKNAITHCSVPNLITKRNPGRPQTNHQRGTLTSDGPGAELRGPVDQLRGGHDGPGAPSRRAPHDSVKECLRLGPRHRQGGLQATALRIDEHVPTVCL